MHSYHNVAKLRQFRGAFALRDAQIAYCSEPSQTEQVIKPLVAAAVDLDVQVANLLSQRVAVEAEQVGGTDLVAPGRRQRGREQRNLDFLEDAMVEARR